MGANPCSGPFRLRLARRIPALDRFAFGSLAESLTSNLLASLARWLSGLLQSHRDSLSAHSQSLRLAGNGSESLLWIASPSARSPNPCVPAMFSAIFMTCSPSTICSHDFARVTLRRHFE